MISFPKNNYIAYGCSFTFNLCLKLIKSNPIFGIDYNYTNKKFTFPIFEDFNILDKSNFSKNKYKIIIFSTKSDEQKKNLESIGLKYKRDFYKFTDFKIFKKILLQVLKDEDFIFSSKLIKKNSVILDIGANLGLFTLTVNANKSIKKSYLIEPNFLLNNDLKTNLKVFKFNKYKIINKSITDKKEKKSSLFLPNKNNSFHAAQGSLTEWSQIFANRISPSSKNKMRSEATTYDKLEISNIGGDQLIKKEKIKKLDFVKIDVEGSELNVLRSMFNSITNLEPIVYIEITDDTQRKIKVITDLFKSYGKLFMLEKNKLKIIKRKLNLTQCSHFYLLSNSYIKKNLSINV